VTALLGAISITVGGIAGIVHLKSKAGSPTEDSDMFSRVAALEGFKEHQEETNKRLQAAVDEQRRRHDENVVGIYKAIDDVRNLFIDLIKNFRKEKS
jgi:hypothetical protein